MFVSMYLSLNGCDDFFLILSCSLFKSPCKYKSLGKVSFWLYCSTNREGILIHFFATNKAVLVLKNQHFFVQLMSVHVRS